MWAITIFLRLDFIPILLKEYGVVGEGTQDKSTESSISVMVEDLERQLLQQEEANRVEKVTHMNSNEEWARYP